MASSNFPRNIQDFASYMVKVTAWLTANATRLGIDAAKLAALQALYGDITTTGTYLYYKNLWDDTEGGRTKKVITNLETVTANLKKMLTGIYDDIPASKWNDDDRETLNRKTGLPHTISHQHTPITEQCYAVFKALGGGEVKVSCKTSDDSTRYSLAQGAKGFEMAYRHDKQGAELAGKPKMMENSDDGTTKKYFPTASAVIKFGDQYAGYWMQAFVRWADPQHPGLEGPWTGPVIVLLT